MTVAAPTIADEILELKRQRRAILLAHHYQEAEIQELADYVGDSLELSRKAVGFALLNPLVPTICSDGHSAA